MDHAGLSTADGLLCLTSAFRSQVDFRLQDITQAMPDELFEIVLCRNLVFTYFDEKQQRLLLARILGCLAPGGFLVLGKQRRSRLVRRAGASCRNYQSTGRSPKTRWNRA